VCTECPGEADAHSTVLSGTWGAMHQCGCKEIEVGVYTLRTLTLLGAAGAGASPLSFSMALWAAALQHMLAASEWAYGQAPLRLEGLHPFPIASRGAPLEVLDELQL